MKFARWSRGDIAHTSKHVTHTYTCCTRRNMLQKDKYFAHSQIYYTHINMIQKLNMLHTP